LLYEQTSLPPPPFLSPPSKVVFEKRSVRVTKALEFWRLRRIGVLIAPCRAPLSREHSQCDKEAPFFLPKTATKTLLPISSSRCLTCRSLVLPWLFLTSEADSSVDFTQPSMSQSWPLLTDGDFLHQV
jgi:hypothetical protein